MKQRKKTNVKLPREREEALINRTRERADDLFDYISDLEIDQESKDYLCEEIEEMCNIQIALLKKTRVKNLRPPWDERTMS